MKLQNCYNNVPYICLRAKMASMFKTVMNENVRALKDALQNLNTRKNKKDQFTVTLS